MAPKAAFGVTALTLVVLLGMALAHQQVDANGIWYVAPTGSDTSDCLSPATPCATLNGAIRKASPSDTILVATGIYTGSGDEVMLIDKNMTLSGGWNMSFTLQISASIIDGQATRRGITVFGTSPIGCGGVVANIERFIVQNGDAGISGGGGIFNCGTVTVTNSLIVSNTMGDSSSSGGGGGGGILNRTGTLVLNNSTVSNNRIIGGFEGGGIANLAGVATLNNSTISNNSRDGIYTFVGTVNLNSSTVSHNAGRGIFMQAGTINLRNSILANNQFEGCGNDQDYSGAIHSFGYNLVQGSYNCSLTDNDLTGIDPKLGPLQDNGGATPTRALLPGSLAINAGSPTGCTDSQGQLLTSDQRGAPRIRRCDIGAYQVTPLLSKKVTGIFRPGGSVTFTVIFDGSSNVDLANVSLTDTLPSPLIYSPDSLSFTTGIGSVEGGTITWIGVVPSNTTTTIVFGATVSNTAIGVAITNTAIGSWAGFSEASSAAFDTFSRIYLPVLCRNYCPNFFDDFGNPNSGWPVGEDDYVRSEYLNGEYRVLSKKSGYLYLFRAPTCERQNYSVETDVRWVGTPGSSYGLIFGVTSDFSQYYLFDMNTDLQRYRLYRRSSSGFTQIVPPTWAPVAIHAGTASNHVKVTRNSSQITLEVNGTVLGTWSDYAFIGMSSVGLVSSPYSDIATSDARFDNVRVTSLASGSTMVQGLNNIMTEASGPRIINRTPLPDQLLQWQYTDKP